MADPYKILDTFLQGHLSRRAFLHRMSSLGLGGAAAAILAACGPSGDDDEDEGEGAAAATPSPEDSGTGASESTAADSPAEQSETGGVLTVGMEAAVPNMDPGQSLGLHSLRVQRLINETLVTTEAETTEIVPLLAESWVMSEDATEWTFQLREGVKFSDGTPLTAEAVKQTFERTIFESHPLFSTGQWTFITGYLAPLEEAIAEDDTTLILRLKYPLASLLSYLALPNLGVMSLKAMEDFGEDIAQNPVGTGPYVLTQYDLADRVELTRNEDYWGTKGKPERIIMRPFPEAQSRVAAILSGDADVIIPVPPDSIEQINDSGTASVHMQPGLTSWYISINVNEPPFDDVRVRQALNYAVDKQAIVGDVLRDTGSIAQGPVPSSSWAFNSDVEKYEYDPEKAKALLAEAGYPDGFDTELWVPDSGSGMQEPEPMATVIQANLAEVGINAELQVFEWGSYLGLLRQETPPLAALSWFLKSDDPDLSVYPLFFSENAPLPNTPGYNNPEIDRLLVEARSTLEQEDRVSIYHEIFEILTNDAPWIFVDHQMEIIGIRQGVEGVTINPNGFDLRVETATIA